MSLVASPPPVCDCCGDFPGLAEGGSEKALISLAALGSLAAAELNRRFNSALDFRARSPGCPGRQVPMALALKALVPPVGIVGAEPEAPHDQFLALLKGI